MDATTTVLPTVDSPAVTARRTLGGQVARFAVVGVLCTGVHLGLFTVFHSWWDSQLANVAALVLATVVNTTLNKSWTFRGAGAGNWVRQQLQALGVFLLTWAATSGGLALLETAWPTAPLVVKVLALAALTAVSTVVRFVAMRRWIFAGGHDPGPLPGRPIRTGARTNNDGGDLPEEITTVDARAEAAGFEPAREVPPNPLSRRAH